MLRSHMARDEHKGHHFSTPEYPMEVKPSIIPKPLPSRSGVFHYLPKLANMLCGINPVVVFLHGDNFEIKGKGIANFLKSRGVD
jgi:hypothetical protein